VITFYHIRVWVSFFIGSHHCTSYIFLGIYWKVAGFSLGIFGVFWEFALTANINYIGGDGKNSFEKRKTKPCAEYKYNNVK
jgi:hypothetical protein